MRVSIPVVLIFILPVLLAGLFLPVRVRVRVEGRPGDFAVRIWVKPPLCPLRLSVSRRLGVAAGKRPREEARGGRRERASGEAEGPDSGRSRETQTLTGTLRRAYDALAVVRDRYPYFTEVLALIFDAVTFENVKITGRVGTGDAYETAVLCGSLNAMAGIVLCVVRRSGARFCRKPVIRVAPAFETAHFSVTADIETSLALARWFYVAGKVSRLFTASRRARATSTLTSPKERGNTRSKRTRRSFLWRGTPSKA